jgi:hypothetical protein
VSTSFFEQTNFEQLIMTRVIHKILKTSSLNSLQRVAPFSPFSSGHCDDNVGGVVVHVGVVILKSKFQKILVVLQIK